MRLNLLNNKDMLALTMQITENLSFCKTCINLGMTFSIQFQYLNLRYLPNLLPQVGYQSNFSALFLPNLKSVLKNMAITPST